MKVPRCRPTLTSAAKKAVERVLASGKFVKGPEAVALEEEFAKYCGVDHAVTVNSGTSALYVTLKAYGFTELDEVILPVNSFMATANAVANVCKPVFADVCPHTFNINVDDIVSKRTVNTRAIMPVHLYGQMAEMSLINAFASANKLFVIEDAAQAHGAEYKGVRAGAWGDMAGFSFFPTKNVGCAGDGGIITCKDETLANYMRAFRDNGRMPGMKDDCAFSGMNLRMSEIQAAVARENLKDLDKNNAARIKYARMYESGLTEHVKTPGAVNGKHIYHLYTLRTEHRDELMKYLRENGVGCNVNYNIQLNKLKAFSKESNDSFPVAESLQKQILSIPMDSTLQKDEVRYVIDMINDYKWQ